MSVREIIEELPHLSPNDLEAIEQRIAELAARNATAPADLLDGSALHVEGARTVIGLLQQMDALDDSLDAEAAVESLAAVSDFRFALRVGQVAELRGDVASRDARLP